MKKADRAELESAAIRTLMATDFSRIVAELEVGTSMHGLGELISAKRALGKQPSRLIDRAKQRLECLDLEGAEAAIAQYRKEIEARKCGA